MELNKRTVYLDHAATTPVDDRVIEAMLPYWGKLYGNPSSSHRAGGAAKAGLDQARLTVADILGARPNEVIFTGCGTESDNLALRGVGWALRHKGRHLITTSIEHHAIGHTCAQMEREYSFEVTYVPVDSTGLVDPDDVARAIRPDTVLVSVMYANNEVGTIEPLAEIVKLAHARGVLVHTDAVQAGGSLDLNVDALQVDLLSLSGHKFHAPKGIGVLFVRQGTPLLPTQTGGGQEMHQRAGTENVAFAVGLARALEIAYSEPSETVRIQALRDQLIRSILEQIPGAHLTGHPSQRLPNSASFVFEGIDGEAILMHLDLAGIAASSGSACTTGETEPSHVLMAMGMDGRLARGSLRLTLGRANTAEDIAYVSALLPNIIERLRSLSPVYARPQ